MRFVPSVVAFLAAIHCNASAGGGFVSSSPDATLTIDERGCVSSIRENGSGRELLSGPMPFVRTIGKPSLAVRSLRTRDDGSLVFGFPDGKGEAVFRIGTFEGGWTFTVVSVRCEGADRFRFGDLVPSCNSYVGSFANMISDDESCVCLRAYEPELAMRIVDRRSLGVDTDGTHPYAGCRFGLVAGPRARIRERLKAMTFAAGVPWSRAGGAWALGARENLGSYMFASPRPTTLDEILAMAERVGVDVLHFSTAWTRRYGHYEPHPVCFPNGDADLRAAIAKARASGLRTGVHTYSVCLSFDDPWVSPRAHSNLLTYASYTLARPFGDGDAELYVNECPVPQHALETTYFSKGNILRIGEELLQYTGVGRQSPYRFTGVTRSAYKTANGGRYPAGARCDYVFERYFAVQPDPTTPFLADVAKTVMASAYDKFGFDRIYWDANDATTPYETALIRRALAAAADQSTRPLQAEASSLGPHNWWFHSAVGAWDYPRWAVKRFHDAHLDYAERECRKSNLMEAQVGWWLLGNDRFAGLQVQREQRIDESEYFASRNAGADVAMSLNFNFADYTNSPSWRILTSATIVGWYERFRMARAFTDEAVARMNRARAEFRLRLDEDGVWRLTPAPCREHRAGTPETMDWRETFPETGRGVIRVEALRSARGYDAPGAIAVIDGSSVPRMRPRAVAKGMEFSFSAGEDPRFGRTIRLSARNAANLPRNATCAGACLRFDRPYFDISANGRDGAFGFWVKGDGSGAILNFVPESPAEYEEVRSDHYVRLDFTGWRYFALALRERDAENHDDYVWPFDWGIHEYPVYTGALVVNRVNAIGFYLNGIPAGGKAEVEVSEVRYLPVDITVTEHPSLTVNGERFDVPFALESGESAQLENGRWLRFARSGELAGSVRAEKDVVLRAGSNAFAFRGGRAQVSVFGSGRPLAALKPRTEWTDESRRRLRYEAQAPVRYVPSAGLSGADVIVARQGETAQLSFRITGAVDSPVLTLTDCADGRRHVIRIPVKMTVNDMLICGDGISWKVVRRLLGGQRRTMAEGRLETALPEVSGRFALDVSSADQANDRATIAFVKRYGK